MLCFMVCFNTPNKEQRHSHPTPCNTVQHTPHCELSMNTTAEGGHEHTPAKTVHRVMQATNAPLAQDDPETKHTAKQLEITMWLNKNHCTKHQQAHHFTQNTKRRGLCANKAKTSHELQQTSPPTRRGNQRVTERSTQCATSRALTK